MEGVFAPRHMTLSSQPNLIERLNELVLKQITGASTENKRPRVRKRENVVV